MQDIQTIDLFGLRLADATTGQVLDGLLSEREPRRIAFVNAHCVNVAAQDRDYARALAGADLLLPDGIGLQIAARMTGRRFRENLNGTDLFPALCRAAAARGQSVFLFGARPGVADGAARTARELAPGLRIAGTEHGYFAPEDEDALIERINRSGADILLVALGVPRQDVWIARNRHRLSPRLAFGVGAQFDFYAGRVQRAPEAVRHAGFEWAWRLAIEPRRMFARYVLGNPVFLMRAARHAVGWYAGRTAATGLAS